MREINPIAPQTIIVGGGPIGIECAVALKQQGIAAIVLEAGSIGNTIAWWAPQTRWFSSNERIAISGVPLLTSDQMKATREEYLTYLRAVVIQFQVDVRTFTRVSAIHGEANGFRISVKSETRQHAFHCKNVVLAIGGTDHPNQLNVPGEELPHVDGYLREVHRYFGRRVVIVGGRNSAAEAALRLFHAGADVTMCYRRHDLVDEGIKYWLLPELRGLIRAERIKAYFGWNVERITPDAVTLVRCDSTEESTRAESEHIQVETDHVLKLIGYSQDKRLLTQTGVDLIGKNQSPVHNPATMETNVKGIYIAGTAIAGTQSSSYKIFLENCHEHVSKIAAHISGQQNQIASQSQSLQKMILVQPES